MRNAISVIASAPWRKPSLTMMALPENAIAPNARERHARQLARPTLRRDGLDGYRGGRRFCGGRHVTEGRGRGRGRGGRVRQTRTIAFREPLEAPSIARTDIRAGPRACRVAYNHASSAGPAAPASSASRSHELLHENHRSGCRDPRHHLRVVPAPRRSRGHGRRPATGRGTRDQLRERLADLGLVRRAVGQPRCAAEDPEVARPRRLAAAVPAQRRPAPVDVGASPSWPTARPRRRASTRSS